MATYAQLATVNQLKQWLLRGSPQSQQSEVDDPEYAMLIQVASELIGRYTGRDNLGAVGTYTENYFKKGTASQRTRVTFSLVLRHYPVAALTAVTANNSPVTILDQTGLQACQSGVFLQTDDVEPRILQFQYCWLTYPITVTYTAGYAPGGIPYPLQQACLQYASEIFRSVDWIGTRSRAINTETITYDTGGPFGMSARVQAMLQPYMDVMPFRGY